MKTASLPRAALLMLAVLILQLAFIASYVGGLHNPVSKNLPVAIVGANGTAESFAQSLSSSAESGVKPIVMGDEATARKAILERKTYAAYLIDPAGSDKLLVASAASPQVADGLSQAFSRAAQTSGRALDFEDVRPLPRSDSRGLSTFYVVVGWVVGGYLVATILGLARGMAGATRRLALLRTGALALYAVVSGIAGAILVEPIMHVLHGQSVGLALAGMLIVFAAGIFTAALESLAGIVGTGVAILLFVVLGNPSSGGPFPWELLPTLWREIGPYLPPGAGTNLLRNIMYFDSNDIAKSVLVLVTYSVVGVIGTLLFARHQLPLDPMQPVGKQYEQLAPTAAAAEPASEAAPEIEHPVDDSKE